MVKTYHRHSTDGNGMVKTYYMLPTDGNGMVKTYYRHLTDGNGIGEISNSINTKKMQYETMSGSSRCYRHALHRARERVWKEKNLLGISAGLEIMWRGEKIFFHFND